MGHVHGEKVSGRHTTVPDGTENFWEAVRSSSEVKQVQWGRISRIRGKFRSSMRRITIDRHRTNQGKPTDWLDVTVRTPLCIQTNMVQPQDPQSDLTIVISRLARQHCEGVTVVDNT